MNIKYNQLQKALSHLKYKSGSDDNVALEFSIREEDIENNKLGTCMVIKLTTTKSPANYDDFKGLQTSEWIVEVFADHENRSPRVTLNQTSDLEVK